jgi:spore coat polysaccharide biosynthesis protein SpsF (cytidylyltransferase family)
MTNTIEQVLLKLTNRYIVRKMVTSILKGHRIGIGKIIIVTCSKDTSRAVQEDLTRDAKPFSVWFYEDTNGI